MGEIPDLSVHKSTVTDILMACQIYMRQEKVCIYIHYSDTQFHLILLQDECSFVSLRDIERAMIVLKWFHSVLDHVEKDDAYKNMVNYCVKRTKFLFNLLNYRGVIVTQEH